MQVLIISGFLGAGKTTFIKELARRCGRQFVVYENEYGQADIDAELLRKGTGLDVWESVENCICCTGKQDFATTVLTIANTLDPDYLVVEPTGVAKLSAVIENVQKVAWERISLLAPVCIADAQSWKEEQASFGPIFDDQLASAPTIVLSKTSGADVDGLMACIQRINPDAHVIADDWRALPDAFWQGLLTTPLEGTADADADTAASAAAADADANSDEPGGGLETLSVEGASLPTPAHLFWLLDALVSGALGKVARAKGFLPCGNEWLRFDVVGHNWAATDTDPVAEGARCTFIGRDLERGALLVSFRGAAMHDHTHHEHEHHHDHEHAHHEDHGHGHEHAHHEDEHQKM